VALWKEEVDARRKSSRSHGDVRLAHTSKANVAIILRSDITRLQH
jgi:hypothetical protein